MDDLIERDKLLCAYCTDCNSGEKKPCPIPGRCHEFNLIKNAPVVNRWIPCSERMPESREGVIFTVDRGHPFVCVGYRINSERDGLKLRRWFDKLSGLNFSDYDVKAWMPMPDAYEPPESEVQ